MRSSEQEASERSVRPYGCQPGAPAADAQRSSGHLLWLGRSAIADRIDPAIVMQKLRSAAQALDRTAGSRRPEAEAAVATRWLGRRQSGSGAGRTWSQLARWGREMCSLPSSSSTAAIIP